MHPGTGITGQKRITSHDRLLGGTRPAGQTQPGSGRALVGNGPDGEPGFLGVLGDQHTKTRGVLQCTAHDERIVHAQPVVGEHPDLRHTRGHQAHLGELAARKSHRHRADRMDVYQPDLPAALPYMVGDHRTVGDGIGVGHREHRGVAAESRCCGTGFDVLGVLPAGFAQMGVQVHQAGQQNLAWRVDHLGFCGARQSGADVGDLTVGDQHVDRITDSVKPGTPDEHHRRFAHTLTAASVPTSRWNRTAIRT